MSQGIDEGSRQSVSREDIFRMMREAMKPHLWWSVVAIGASILSSFQISFKGGALSLAFGVNTVTALLVTMVWLPSLLAILGWTGVNLKTPVGEASSGGLATMLRALPPGARTDVLSAAAASLEDVRQKARGPHQAQADRALTVVRQEMVSSAEESNVPLRPRLAELAGQYDAVRANLPSGAARTRQMSALVEQAQAAAKADAEAAERYLSEHLNDFVNLHGGERVVALGVVRALAPRGGLGIVSHAILNAESPYEQYQALRACEAIAMRHGPAAARAAGSALETALRGEATIPLRGSDREALAVGLSRLIR